MSLLKVDPGNLAATAAQVQNAIAVANDIRSKSGSLQAEAGCAGHPQAQEAIRGFMSAWSWGLQILGEDGSTLASFLQLAGTAYEKAEDDIAQAAGL